MSASIYLSVFDSACHVILYFVVIRPLLMSFACVAVDRGCRPGWPLVALLWLSSLLLSSWLLLVQVSCLLLVSEACIIIVVVVGAVGGGIIAPV